jgi:ADP-heptose:LPS heptosyltransferase
MTTSPKKFLILQLRAMGDVLISTTLCETLKKNFPGATVDMVVYPYTASVLDNNPFIDELFILPETVKEKGISAIWHFLKTARKKKYDYCINVLGIPKSTWLGCFAGAKHMIARQKSSFYAKLNSIQVTPDPNFLKALPVSCSVKNRLELLTPIFDFSPQWVSDYKIYLSIAEKKFAADFLRHHAIDTTKPVFFVAPIGHRQWPTDYWKTLLNHFITHYHATLIASPAPGELEKTKALRETLCKPEALIINETGKLRDSAALMSQTQAFMGNDGGASHLAIGLDIPSLTIYCPRIDYRDWSPVGNPRHVTLTVQDALGLSENEYDALLREKSREELMALYPTMTTEMVVAKLENLLRA